MRKARIFTGCILWLLALGQLSAQGQLADEKLHRLIFIAEIGYLSGTGNIYLDNTDLSNEGLGARLRFILGHRINKHFSAGLGFGLDGFHDPTYNTFPVFIDARGYLKNTQNTPFAYFDLGYAAGITDKFEKGFLTSLGLGYKLYFGLFGRKVHFLPSVGFNLQKIERDRQIIITNQFSPQLASVKDNISVKSFTIKLGVEL